MQALSCSLYGGIMSIKSTLLVIKESSYPGRRGVTDGQTYQRLIGWPEVNETDRIRLGRATYAPGTYEQLHWHPIEACYYVISGNATVRNIEGNEYEVSAGSMIYAPAGIAGAHEWEVKETLEILDIRACNETNRKIQYTVDKQTMRSYIDLEDLHYREAISFKSHY
jgi:quercetin dioxygenase-like cupin family protein